MMESQRSDTEKNNLIEEDKRTSTDQLLEVMSLIFII